MARNELAHYLSVQRRIDSKAPADPRDVDNFQFLPPTIDNPRECRTCYAVDSCMLYRKVRTYWAVVIELTSGKRAGSGR